MAWHCVKWSEDQWLSSKQFFYCLLCPALPSHQTPKQCYSSGVPFLRGFIAFASKTRLKYFQICLVREGKGPTAAPEFTFPAESSHQPRESRRPEWVRGRLCVRRGRKAVFPFLPHRFLSNQRYLRHPRDELCLSPCPSGSVSPLARRPRCARSMLPLSAASPAPPSLPPYRWTEIFV